MVIMMYECINKLCMIICKQKNAIVPTAERVPPEEEVILQATQCVIRVKVTPVR